MSRASETGTVIEEIEPVYFGNDLVLHLEQEVRFQTKRVAELRAEDEGRVIEGTDTYTGYGISGEERSYPVEVKGSKG